MESILSYLLPLSPYLLALAALFIFLDQISYLKRKRLVPGPFLVPPFIGNALRLVTDPAGFWDAQSDLAKSIGFSANYVVGRFILFIRDTELSHKIFANVRPDAFHFVGYPFGKKLFGDHNIIYMMGQEHKDLRRRIAPNFTPKALSTYTASQQLIILTHFEKWLSLSTASDTPVTLRLLVRDMNLETSQKVFTGPYLSEAGRERFNADCALFSVGLLALPFDFPGFAFRRARLAVDRLGQTLAVCAGKSKARMENGEEPTCLIDFWMQDTVKEMAAAKEAGEAAPPHSDDHEIGGNLFNFLIAAQDASTSSLLWAVTLLDSHPEVLSKVREEVAKLWSPEKDSLITGEQLREMKYTEAVAREVIRYRAPAAMVPHIAGEDFPLTNTYTIPKGTIVFPSVFEAAFQGFNEPARFDPDRFSEDRREDRIFKRNLMAFGAGPHQCVGQRYAINHLMLFIAMFTASIDFKRFRTNGCDEIIYMPTIYPKDDCTVAMKRRSVGGFSFPTTS